MKLKDIKVGNRYVAKVSGKLTTVRVDAIKMVGSIRGTGRDAWAYEVTNLSTGRKITFRSARRFRGLPPRYWLGVQDRNGTIHLTEWQTADEAKDAKERAKTNSDNVRVALTVSDSQKTAYERFQKAWGITGSVCGGLEVGSLGGLTIAKPVKTAACWQSDEEGNPNDEPFYPGEFDGNSN